MAKGYSAAEIATGKGLVDLSLRKMGPRAEGSPQTKVSSQSISPGP